MAEAERGSFAIPGSKSDGAAADGDYVPKNIFLTGGAGEFCLFCSTSCATQILNDPPPSEANVFPPILPALQCTYERVF